MSYSYNPYTVLYPDYYPDLSIPTHAPIPNDVDFSQSTWDALNGSGSADYSFGGQYDIYGQASSGVHEPYFDFNNIAMDQVMDVNKTVNEPTPAPVSTPFNGNFPSYPSGATHVPSFPGGVAGPTLPSHLIHNSHSTIYNSTQTTYHNNLNILSNSLVQATRYTGHDATPIAGGSRVSLHNSTVYQFDAPLSAPSLHDTRYPSGNTLTRPVESRVPLASIHNGPTFPTLHNMGDSAATVHNHAHAFSPPQRNTTQDESQYPRAGGIPLEDIENVPAPLKRKNATAKRIAKKRKADVQGKRIRKARKVDMPNDRHICRVQKQHKEASIICWEEFGDKLSLGRHIKQVHSKANNKDSKGAKSYRCQWSLPNSGELCPNELKGSGGMLRHLLEVHAKLFRKECKFV